MPTTRARSRSLSAALVVVAALTLGACSSSKGASSRTPQLAGPVTNKGTKTVSGSSVSIKAGDFYFEPTFIDAKPGTTLSVSIENVGNTTHTFTIDSQHIDQEVAPDHTARVMVKVPPSGALEFSCRFHRSNGMQGAVVAVP
jgi:plastocyanin